MSKKSNLSKTITGAAIGAAAMSTLPITGVGTAVISSSLLGAKAISTAVGAAGISGAIIASKSNLKKNSSVTPSSFDSKDTKWDSEIKEMNDFYIATAALSYYVARVDGIISDEEYDEIYDDLSFLKSNYNISDEAKKKVNEISQNKNLTFSDVCIFLDKVDIERLKILSFDINQIIEVDDNITPEELETQKLFNRYIQMRK